MRKRTRWIAWIVIVCLIAAGGGGYWWYTSKDTKAATSGPSFMQSRVTKGTITKSVAGSGAVEVSESETIKPSGNATVDKVKVAEGDEVKKGTVLATFEGEDVSLALSKSELSLEQLQMQLEQAQDKWKSLQVSGAEQSDIDSAAMSIKSIQLNIKQTQLDMQDTRDKAKAPDPLVASIDGTVTAVNVKDGDSVTGQIEAFTIVNYDKLDIQISADELDISQLKVGQTANITMDALSGQSFTGKVTKIAKEGTSSNGVATFPVTVRLDKTDGVLPGMNGSVDVVIESKQDALLVPVEAVTQMGTKYFVRVPETGTSGDQSGSRQPAAGAQSGSGATAGAGSAAGNGAPSGDEAAPGSVTEGVRPGEMPEGVRSGTMPEGGQTGAGQSRFGGYRQGAGSGGQARQGGFTRSGMGQGQAAAGASTEFTLKEITVGITTDSQVEVLTGLTEGQTVLIPVTVSSGSGNQQQMSFGMGGMGGGFQIGGGAFPAGGMGGGNFGGGRTGGTGVRAGAAGGR